jgi:hypothetical protein
MLDGHEQCGGCECRTPTGTVAPEVQEHGLTPSEVALARVLAAWEAWPGDPDTYSANLHDIGVSLHRLGLLSGGEPSETGQTLLARARKAGVV